MSLLILSILFSGCSGSPPLDSSVSPVALSPFTGVVHLNGFSPFGVIGVQYTIAAKPGSVSRPVHVEYSIAALRTRGYVGSNSLTVPIFGLYAGCENTVSLEVNMDVGTVVPMQITFQTPPYVDPTGIYSRPSLVAQRQPGSSLGFDFIFIKSALGSPIVIDTDGEIRWAAPAAGVANSTSSEFTEDEFIIGNTGPPTVYRLGLDGSSSRSQLPFGSSYTDFNHNIDRGKVGFLAEVDASNGEVANIESNVIELQDSGFLVSLSNHWDLAQIIGSYMTSHGDDAAAFVRPGVDWFHANAAFYDSADDSVLVSSRENFVVKLDYQTGAIQWILGDPTKYWYSFPSLRAKALTLTPGGLYPIGQHAISITSDGYLMLFNDGLGSLNQPPGAPAGETRTYSAVSAYSINDQAMTATNVWNYRAGEQIFSAVCSSAYEVNKSLLVDYAVADGFTKALLVGLDSNHQVAFEFEYPTDSCDTSWNSRPIPLENLTINQ